MFGTWDGPDIASFWFAVAAFILSVVAVGYTHAAHRRERRRERERERPPVEARFDKWLSKGVVLQFALENRGAVIVDRATVEVVSGDPTLVGFAEHATDHPRRRERDFGKLNPGQPATAEFVTQGKELEPGIVKFVATFVRGGDEWSEQYRVEIPSQGPFIA